MAVFLSSFFSLVFVLALVPPPAARAAFDSSFSASSVPTPFPAAEGHAVAAGDLDGDGGVDAVVVARAPADAREVRWYAQGPSSGAAGVVGTLAGLDDGTGDGRPLLLLRDTDRDGFLDVVAGDAASGLQLFTNRLEADEAAFEQTEVLAPGGFTMLAAEAAAFGGSADAVTSYVVSRQFPTGVGDTLRLVPADGGGFEQQALPGGLLPRALLAADCDDDGDLDLVALTSSGVAVYLFDDALQRFASPVPNGADAPGGTRAILANVRGRSKPDLVYVDFAGSVRLVEGPAYDGTAEEIRAAAGTSAIVTDLVAGELSSPYPGCDDLVVVQSGEGEGVYGMLNSACSTRRALWTRLPASPSRAFTVAAADVTGTGTTDLVVGTDAGGAVWLLENAPQDAEDSAAQWASAGAFEENAIEQFFSSFQAQAVVQLDVAGAGAVEDYVVSGDSGNLLVVLGAELAGAARAFVAAETGNGVRAMAATNANADGLDDLVLLTDVGDVLVVLQQAGAPFFSTVTRLVLAGAEDVEDGAAQAPVVVPAAGGDPAARGDDLVLWDGLDLHYCEWQGPAPAYSCAAVATGVSAFCVGYSLPGPAAAAAAAAVPGEPQAAVAGPGGTAVLGGPALGQRAALGFDLGSPSAMACGDLNGDARGDVAFTYGSGFRALLSEGSDGGATVANVASSPSQVVRLVLHDVDGDGDADVVVSSRAPGASDAYWYENRLEEPGEQSLSGTPVRMSGFDGTDGTPAERAPLAVVPVVLSTGEAVLLRGSDTGVSVIREAGARPAELRRTLRVVAGGLAPLGSPPGVPDECLFETISDRSGVGPFEPVLCDSLAGALSARHRQRPAGTLLVDLTRSLYQPSVPVTVAGFWRRRMMVQLPATGATVECPDRGGAAAAPACLRVVTPAESPGVVFFGGPLTLVGGASRGLLLRGPPLGPLPLVFPHPSPPTCRATREVLSAAGLFNVALPGRFPCAGVGGVPPGDGSGASVAVSGFYGGAPGLGGHGGCAYVDERGGDTRLATPLSVSGCAAPGRGGGLYVALAGGGASFDASAAGASVSATNCSSGGAGGGVAVVASAPGSGARFGAVTVAGADALGAGCGGLLVDGGDQAGGSLRFGGLVSLTGCAAAAGGGGGMCVGGGAAVEVGSCDVSGNSAASEGGGGVAVFGQSSLSASGACAVAGNSASGGGGGVRCVSSALALGPGSSVTGNTATGGGGGVFASSCEVTVGVPRGGSAGPAEVSRNNATGGAGGGILCVSQDGAVGSLVLGEEAEVSGNRAADSGGGVASRGCELAADPGSSVSLNEAAGESTPELCTSAGETRGGGGLYVADAAVSVSLAGEVRDNTATAGSGGGLLLAAVPEGVPVSLEGAGSFTGNAAPLGGGGGIFWQPSERETTGADAGGRGSARRVRSLETAPFVVPFGELSPPPSGNTALYGPNLATPAVASVVDASGVSSTVQESRFAPLAGELLARVVDFYNATVATDSTSRFTAQAGSGGNLFGTVTATAFMGVANFTGLLFLEARPGASASLSIAPELGVFATFSPTFSVDIAGCEPGQFREDLLRCRDCPAGRSGDGAASSCGECAAGTRSEAGSSSCSLCGPGSFAEAGLSSACTDCAVGTFAAGNASTVCEPCPLGRFGNETGLDECFSCDAGSTTTRLGALECFPCPAGRFEDGADACGSCPAGTFTPSDGLTRCEDCPAGRHAPNGGSASCVACPPGSFSDSGGADACEACPAGLFAPLENSTACEDCPAGRHAPNGGSASCVACPPGSFSDSGGVDACEACPAGRFASLENSTACEPCGDGEYAPFDGLPECQPCAPGTALAAGAAPAVECDECAPGRFANASGLPACDECPAGASSAAPRSSRCDPCPAGQFQNQSTLLCEQCAPGRSSGAEGATSCDECAAGSAGPLPGAVACQPCGPGTFEGGGGATECRECPAGRVSNGSGLTACLDCEPGSSSAAARSTVCQPCFRGSFQNATTLLCQLCPPGRFGDAEGRTSCERCAPGSFAPLPGAVGCQACPPGSAAPLGASAECAGCAPGRFSNASGLAACLACAPGTSTPVGGAAACEACQPGQFQNASTLLCEPCAAGKFQAAAAATSCGECPAGTQAPFAGSVQCGPCPRGEWGGAAGLSSCSLCAPGRFAPATSRTRCNECAAGRFAAEPGSVSCGACAPGRAQAARGATSCDGCAPHTFSSSDAQESCAPCSSLSAFHFSRRNSSQFCELCPVGRYLVFPRRETFVGCEPCPEGILCDSGQLPRASNGFWVDISPRSGLARAFECGNAAACGVRDAGSCGDNRRPAQGNVLCGRCVDGYQESGGVCVPCSETNWGLLALLLAVGFAAVLVVYRLSQGGSDAHVVILSYFVQVSLLLIGGGGESGEVFSVLRELSNFNVLGAGGGSCVVKVSDRGRMLSVFVSDAVIVGALLLVWAAHMAVRRARGAKFSHVPWVRALLSVYLLTFNGVVDAAFAILNCVTVSDSGVEVDVVQRYPAVECGTREHGGPVALAVLVLVFVVVVLPAVLFRAQRRGHRLAAEGSGPRGRDRALMKFSDPYRPACRSWQFSILARRVVVVAFVVFLASRREWQLAAVTIASVAVAFLQMVFRPFHEARANALELFSLSVICVLSVLLSAMELPYTDGEEAALLVLWFVPCVLLLALMLQRRATRLVDMVRRRRRGGGEERGGGGGGGGVEAVPDEARRGEEEGDQGRGAVVEMGSIDDDADRTPSEMRF